MKATFDLSGYSLIVGGQFQETDPNCLSQPVDLSKVVPIQIIHHPLPGLTKRCDKCGTTWHGEMSPDVCPECSAQHPITRIMNAPDETIFYVQLEPSHARAIASAILSAATKPR